MLRDDRRGQSIQIGAILLFGILIIGLSIVQTVVVPAENEGVEFNGYVDASDDMVTLRNDILTAGTRGGEQATSVRTGVRYPARAIFINPGPPVGSLQTTAAENVTISGVKAVNGEEENVRGFWSDGTRNYSTRGVRFNPAYNNIDVPPVESSGTGAHRLTANGPISLTGQSFVTGNRITLVTVDGELGASSLTTAVSSSPASVATRSVTLTGTGGNDFNITLPVPGDNATAWSQSRTADSLRQNDNVRAVTPVGNRVNVTFDGSQTYELKVAKVVVHDAGDSGVNATTDPAYIVATEGNGSSTPAAGTRRVAVEVRDEYNNPVSGVNVSFSTGNGTFDSTGDGVAEVTTGSEGRAPVFVTPNESSVAITASFNRSAPYNETVIRLTDATGDGGVSDINEESRGVVLGETTAVNGKNGGVVGVGFDNTASANRTITQVRVSFYDAQGSGGSDPGLPSSAEIINPGDPQGPITVGGSFFTLPTPITLVNNTETTVEFDFGNSAKVGNDFFILSVTYENGDRVTYFISVPS